MSDDIFAERVAKVRQRFMSSLGEKIDTTYAALPGLGGIEPPAAAAVAEAYRCIHGIVGIGRTVGFPAIGTAAHDAEDVLRLSYHAGRGLTDDEISLLKRPCRPCATWRRVNCKPTPPHTDHVTMTRCMRVTLMLGWALVLLPAQAYPQNQTQSQPPTFSFGRPSTPPQPRQKTVHRTLVSRATVVETAAAASPAPAPKSNSLIAAITLADIGFANGLRFANLGGQHELYVPLPQDSDVAASNLVVVLDDFIAYEAKRNLEVRINNRTVATIVLDGKGRNRTI